MKYIALGLSILALCSAIGPCTYSMCHPYKLNGLCEYVGKNGLEKE